MVTQVGIGVSHHRNPVIAAQEAVEQARQHGSIEQQPDFVLLFSMVGYSQAQLLQAVRAATQQTPLIGCSGAGIITTSKVDESNFGVVIMLLKSDDIRIHYGIVPETTPSSLSAGQQVGEAVRSHLAADTAALLLFADGIAFNFDAFLRGLGDVSMGGRSLPIIGGLAGDNLAYEKTYQYYNDQLMTEGTVWALLSGPIQCASAITHGCVPIGNQHTITKCHGNAIYEVDHQPVLDILEDYLHSDEVQVWDKAAVNLGLAFPSANPTDPANDYFIRCMIARDAEAGCVLLQTEVTQGDVFWITRRDFDKILAGTKKMADTLLAHMDGASPKFILQVECDGRGKIILREQEKLALLEVLQSRLGNHTPWIGLYAFAEIAPIGQENHIHNFSSIVTAVY